MSLNIAEKPVILLGVISDTHGLLRPSIPDVFQDVDLILHAGDIDTPEILGAIRSMAPLVCVRGNMDAGKWSKSSIKPKSILVQVALTSLSADIHIVRPLEKKTGSCI